MWPKGHDAKRIFLIVRSKETKLFLIAGVHGNLMVALLVIEAHHEERAVGIAKIFNCVVTTWDGVFKWSHDQVEFAIGDAHMPYKIFNTCNVFLVRFCGKGNRGTPWPLVFCDPAIGQEVAYMHHNHR